MSLLSEMMMPNAEFLSILELHSKDGRREWPCITIGQLYSLIPELNQKMEGVIHNG